MLKCKFLSGFSLCLVVTVLLTLIASQNTNLVVKPDVIKINSINAVIKPDVIKIDPINTVVKPDALKIEIISPIRTSRWGELEKFLAQLLRSFKSPEVISILVIVGYFLWEIFQLLIKAILLVTSFLGVCKIIEFIWQILNRD
ncbi:MAG: hypothetical protein ACFKPT_05085 [Gloeotrichia echinulata GP01]